MKGKMKSAALFLLALVLCSCAMAQEMAVQEVTDNARKQLAVAQPDLAVTEDNKVAQLEEVWKTGKVQAYYAQALSVANEILAAHKEKIEVKPVAATLLQNLISKGIPPAEITDDDLWAMRRLASVLFSGRTVPVEDSLHTIQLFSKFLGRIRSEIVPGFVFTTSINVDIDDFSKDPHEIAELEAVKKETRMKNRANIRQKALFDMERQEHLLLVIYMQQTFSEKGVSREFIDECISDARFTDSEKAGVIDQIARARRS